MYIENPDSSQVEDLLGFNKSPTVVNIQKVNMINTMQ